MISKDLQTLPESPEAALKKRRLDEDYKKKGSNFSEQKKSLGELLGFGSFKLQKKLDDKDSSIIIDRIENPLDGVNDSKEKKVDKEKINEKDFNKFKENPAFPIIQRLSINLKKRDGITLPIEDFTIIYKKIKGKESTGNIIDDLINVIKESNLSTTEKGVNIKNLLLEDLIQIKKKNDNNEYGNENKRVEKKGKIILPESFKNYDFLMDETSSTVKLLASNYIDFPEEVVGEKDVEKDLEIAFNLTVNKIIDKYNFVRTEAFETALMDVRNGKMEEKFYALRYIYSLAQINGGKGKKYKDAFKKNIENHIHLKKIYLDFKIRQINILIKNTNNTEKREELLEKLEMYEKEKNVDDFEGEVFESGKEDKLGNNSESNNSKKI